MSKGSKRRGYRYQRNLYNYLFRPPPKPKVIPARHPWLDMTDDEIDKAYFHFGKASRTNMKKEAAVERQRLAVRKILSEENASDI